MRLVYIDEAGIGNAKEEPWLVVAGIIVNADKQLRTLEKALRAIVERHIPKEFHSTLSLHAKEIFNGGGPVFDREKFPLDKRLAIADELAALPARLKLPLALGFVERSDIAARIAKFPNRATKYMTSAHNFAFVLCSLQVEMWMRERAPKEVCLLVVEDNDQARSEIRETHKLHQNPEIVAMLDEETKPFFPLRMIKEDPLFQGKRPNSPLQLADFCAYIFKRFLMNQSDERYLRFFDPMRPAICAIPLNKFSKPIRKTGD